MRPDRLLLWVTPALTACVGPGPTPRPVTRGVSCAAPPVAESFAPALADSGRLYGGSFTPDGDTLYYFRKVSADLRQEDYRIYRSHRAEGDWSPAERVNLGGDFSDLYPKISPDGRRLVFASYRRAPGDTAAKPNATLWQSHRAGSGWGEPSPLTPLNVFGSYHSQPAFDREGRLHFRRTSPDWRTTADLVSEPEGQGFTAPRPDTVIARWRDARGDIRIWGGWPGHHDGYVLLDVSRIDSVGGRPGPSDIWVSLRGEETWSPPRPLGAGVAAERQFDTFAFTSPDGCQLAWVRGFSRFYRVSLAAALAEPGPGAPR